MIQLSKQRAKNECFYKMSGIFMSSLFNSFFISLEPLDRLFLKKKHMTRSKILRSFTTHQRLIEGYFSLGIVSI